MVRGIKQPLPEMGMMIMVRTLLAVANLEIASAQVATVNQVSIQLVLRRGVWRNV